MAPANRQTVGLILATPTNYDVLAFRYFILSLNKVQSIYEFSFPEVLVEYEEEEEYTEADLFKSIAAIDEIISPAFDYLMVITTRRIEGNLFFTSQEKSAAITTDTWEAYFSPPSLFEYLLHCICASLLFMHPALDLDSHTDTRGCVLDYTRWKQDDRIDIGLGYICDSDSQQIKQRINAEYLAQMQFTISRRWIGTVNDTASVAYELKHLFGFDIVQDSGFNKTFWQRAKGKLDEVPLEAIKVIIETIMAVLLAAILLHFGLKKD